MMNDPLAALKEEHDPDGPLKIEDPLYLPTDAPLSIKEEINATTDENLPDVNNIGKDQICSICDFSYSKKEYLDRHIKKIHQENRSKYYTNQICSICNGNFKSKDSLSMHIKRLHSEKKGSEKKIECVECQKCGKTYKSKDAFRSHNRNFHTTNSRKKVECKICGALRKR